VATQDCHGFAARQSYLNAILQATCIAAINLPIDRFVISPEREVAEAALQRLSAPATFDNRKLSWKIGFKVNGHQFFDEDCRSCNTTSPNLSDLFFSNAENNRLSGVRREGVFFFAPEAGDQLFLRMIR